MKQSPLIEQLENGLAKAAACYAANDAVSGLAILEGLLLLTNKVLAMEIPVAPSDVARIKELFAQCTTAATNARTRLGKDMSAASQGTRAGAAYGRNQRRRSDNK